jgi:signal peptidase I
MSWVAPRTIPAHVYPNDRTSIYVKRIIGLPGDEIEMTGTDLKVNGESLVKSGPSTKDGRLVVEEAAESGETYDVYWQLESPGSKLSLTVPNGQVFVLGDNRDESHDSRKFGTVPLVDVIGVARQVFFSSADVGLRIGKIVDVN